MRKLKNNKNINRPKKKREELSDKTLLRLWGQAVIERAGHRCEYPGCRVNYTQLHPHHLYTRRWRAMRYNLMAGMALCPYHHTFGPDSAHQNPDFKDLIIATGVRTAKFFEELRMECNKSPKNSPEFRRECLEKLKPYLRDQDR